MSTSSPSEPLLTAEDLYDLPDDGRHRYELVDGRLVVSEPPGMTHGGITVNFAMLLGTFVRQHRLGRVYGEAGYVLRRGPDTVRGPDVSFVRADRLPPRGRAHRFYEGAADLVVEIVSPGDRAGELARKVAGYLAAGTALVWVVYPEIRTVVAHRPDGTARVHGEDDTLHGGDVLPGFAVRVAELFPELPDAPPDGA